jgi:fatty acid desaturase
VQNGWLNLLGTVLVSHSLIYSAYLSHEFMHRTIFKSRRWNVMFGNLMLWFNGGCYYGFEALTLQHIAHHVDRVDVFTFDIPAAIQKLPTAVRQIIVALEWCYVPVVSLWAHGQSMFRRYKSLNNYQQKLKFIAMLIIRLATFFLLGRISFKALMLYFLAYLGMITALRFMDAFQHTYEAFPVGSSLPKRSNDHEQNHTYSNLISHRYPWLNLLVLNFVYHNAHHAVMKCPWHSIPELDMELAQSQKVNYYISLSQQLTNYHKYRITRLFAGQGKTIEENGKRNYEKFYGASDVSFITLY